MFSYHKWDDNIKTNLKSIWFEYVASCVPDFQGTCSMELTGWLNGYM